MKRGDSHLTRSGFAQTLEELGADTLSGSSMLQCEESETSETGFQSLEFRGYIL